MRSVLKVKPMEVMCSKLRGLITKMMMISMMMGCVSGTGTLHRVGGKLGWTPSVNFTEWSSHESFYVNDWLIFNFDKNMYNVLEVNKTSYESCNDQGFIKNITKGGRDVFQLTEPRPYYFLSGRGFCWGGLKAAIFVQETAPTPAPVQARNGSPSSTGSRIMALVMVAASISLTWTVL
ncbi:hypothetical protein AB3S75_029440 [Citrus x aurantiifolia]